MCFSRESCLICQFILFVEKEPSKEDTLEMDAVSLTTGDDGCCVMRVMSWNNEVSVYSQEDISLEFSKNMTGIPVVSLVVSFFLESPFLGYLVVWEYLALQSHKLNEKKICMSREPSCSDKKSVVAVLDVLEGGQEWKTPVNLRSSWWCQKQTVTNAV